MLGLTLADSVITVERMRMSVRAMILCRHMMITPIKAAKTKRIREETAFKQKHEEEERKAKCNLDSDYLSNPGIEQKGIPKILHLRLQSLEWQACFAG